MNEIIYAFCSPGYLNIPKVVFLPEEKNKQTVLLESQTELELLMHACMHACIPSCIQQALVDLQLGVRPVQAAGETKRFPTPEIKGHSLVGEVNKQIVVL